MATDAHADLSQLHQVFFNASPTPMVLCEEDGNVLGINPAAETLFGVTLEDAMGTHVGRMLPQFPGSCMYGVTLRGAFTCRVEASQVQLQYRTAQLLLVHNDRAANKTALVMGLHREIDTALQALEGNPPPGRHDVERACKQAKSALRAISDICRFDAPATTLPPEPLDLEDLMVQALCQADDAAAQRGLLLMYRLDVSVPASVMGDRERLDRALCAVVRHAMQRTQRGYITVEAAATASAQHATTVHIVVRDNSPTAAPAEVAAWLRLPRYDNSPQTKDAIALVAAQNALEHMGGSLEIERDAAIGTLYRLRFVTRATAIAAPHAVQLPPWRGPQAALAGKPVIVADPNVATSALLRDTLRNWGAMPTVANTVAQAAALVIAQPGCPVVTTMTGTPLAELIDRVANKAAHFVALANGHSAAWQLIVDEAIHKGVRVAQVASPFFPRDILRQLCQPTWSQTAGARSSFAAPSRKPDAPGLVAAMDPATIPEVRVHEAMAAAASAPTERAARKRTSISPPVMTPGLRILAAVVDPDRRNRLVQELARYGYRADVASPGRAAIRAAELRHFDVVVVDDLGGRESLDTINALAKHQQLVIVGLTAVAGSLVPRPGISEFWTYPPNADWGRRLDQLANRRGGMAVGTNTPGTKVVGGAHGHGARPSSHAQVVPATQPQTWRSVSTTRPHVGDEARPANSGGRVASQPSREDDVLARLSSMVNERGMADTVEFTAMNMAELHALVVEMRVAKASWRNRLTCHVLALAGNIGAETLCQLAQQFVDANLPNDEAGWEILLQEIDEVCTLLERHVRSFRHQHGADAGA